VEHDASIGPLHADHAGPDHWIEPFCRLERQQAAPVIPNPTARDMFQLNDLGSYRQFSSIKNFEIVGHSYLRGPWLTPGAPGAGVNTLRICGNVAYLGGYNPTVYGTLIVDVSNPARMEPLSFIPANPGTRNACLRVDCDQKVLAVGTAPGPTVRTSRPADSPLGAACRFTTSPTLADR